MTDRECEILTELEIIHFNLLEVEKWLEEILQPFDEAKGTCVD